MLCFLLYFPVIIQRVREWRTLQAIDAQQGSGGVMTFVIGREKAQQIIGKARLGWLRSCVERAWVVWKNGGMKLLPTCEQSALPTVFRQLVLQQIKDTLEEQDGVSIHPYSRHRFLLVIDDVLVVQIRKLTANLRTRNIETETSKDFDRQLSLAEYPDYPRLTLGYQFTDYHTDLSEILLVFNVGNHNQWYYDLRTNEHSLEMPFEVRHLPIKDADVVDAEADADQDAGSDSK